MIGSALGKFNRHKLNRWLTRIRLGGMTKCDPVNPWADRSRYTPHQGEQEKARRLRQRGN